MEINKKKKTLKTIAEKLDCMSKFLDAKKADKLLQVDVQESTTLCDYFIFASAKNSTQVKGMCEGLEEELSKKYGIEPKCRDGIKDGKWAVLDYGDIIVHILLDEVRTQYDIDSIWVNEKNNTINYTELSEALLLEKRKLRLAKIKEQQDN